MVFEGQPGFGDVVFEARRPVGGHVSEDEGVALEQFVQRFGFLVDGMRVAAPAAGGASGGMLGFALRVGQVRVFLAQGLLCINHISFDPLVYVNYVQHLFGVLQVQRQVWVVDVPTFKFKIF